MYVDSKNGQDGNASGGAAHQQNQNSQTGSFNWWDTHQDWIQPPTYTQPPRTAAQSSPHFTTTSNNTSRLHSHSHSHELHTHRQSQSQGYVAGYGGHVDSHVDSHGYGGDKKMLMISPEIPRDMNAHSMIKVKNSNPKPNS